MIGRRRPAADARKILTTINHLQTEADPVIYEQPNKT